MRIQALQPTQPTQPPTQPTPQNPKFRGTLLKFDCTPKMTKQLEELFQEFRGLGARAEVYPNYAGIAVLEKDEVKLQGALKNIGIEVKNPKHVDDTEIKKQSIYELCGWD